MLTSTLAQSLALGLMISTFTACTIKGSGSQRVQYGSSESGGEGSGDSSADASASDESAASGEEASEACLKLAEKRKNNLKLLEDGEDPVAETAEETASCPAQEEASDGGSGEEEAAAE